MFTNLFYIAFPPDQTQLARFSTLWALKLTPAAASPKLPAGLRIQELCMSFQCTVVTPEEQSFDQTVTQAILPAHDGQIGILTDRAPLLVKLGQGPLRLDLASGGRQLFYIEGGVAQMKDNRLTILTNEALR